MIIMMKKLRDIP